MTDAPLFRRVPPMHALAAFEAAARLGGFAPAADELCVTPSAVSHRIRQLERQLDMQLFERTPTGVKLTTSGRMYLARVREAFVSLAQHGDGSASRARLRVSIPPTFARQLFMPRLPAYLSSRADLDLEVHVTNSLAASHDEPVDLSIIWSDGSNLSGVAHRLFDEAIGPLASPAVVAEWGLGTPKDLARAPLLRTPLLPWSPWFQAAGLSLPEPDHGASFNDLGMLLEAASVGLGVALCSRRLAAQWIDDGRLVMIGTVTAVPPHSYYVTCDRARLARPEVAEFVDWLREGFAE